MSDCLSVTAITRVDTMLNAATATISSRMQEHHASSRSHGAEEIGVALRPVGDVIIGPTRLCASSRVTRRAEQIVSFSRTPDTSVAQP